MERNENIEKIFDNHIATIKKCGDITKVIWSKVDSIYFSIKYVFDGNNVYVTGDIGEAIFVLTWNADIDSFADTNLSYFHGKLKAFDDEMYEFNCEKAISTLEQWRSELDLDEINYDKETFQNLISHVDNCSTNSDWINMAIGYDDFFSDLDIDCNEWIFDIGKQIPRRISYFLKGLQMASDQLKEKVA